MTQLQSIEEFRNLAEDDKPFCAVFSADWCPDCQVIKAALPGIENEYADRYTFAVVDRDRFMKLADEYEVLGIPSFLVFRSGKVVDIYINRLRKTRREITDFLDTAYAKI